MRITRLRLARVTDFVGVLHEITEFDAVVDRAHEVGAERFMAVDAGDRCEGDRAFLVFFGLGVICGGIAAEDR